MRFEHFRPTRWKFRSPRSTSSKGWSCSDAESTHRFFGGAVHAATLLRDLAPLESWPGMGVGLGTIEGPFSARWYRDIERSLSHPTLAQRACSWQVTTFVKPRDQQQVSDPLPTSPAGVSPKHRPLCRVAGVERFSPRNAKDAIRKDEHCAFDPQSISESCWLSVEPMDVCFARTQVEGYHLLSTHPAVANQRHRPLGQLSRLVLQATIEVGCDLEQNTS